MEIFFAIAVPASLWALVALAGKIVNALKLCVYAYRIKQGRMQMNDWLKFLGDGLDQCYEEGKPYSRDALKFWIADCSVKYFKGVADKRRR